MCEVAGNNDKRGDSRATLTALRYYEEIQPAELGAENQKIREAALELLRD
jgi:hypothetical protein